MIDRPLIDRNDNNSQPNIVNTSSAVNIDLIDHLIASPKIAKQLKVLCTDLSAHFTIQYFTDGSLSYHSENYVIMGLGWVCANDEDKYFNTFALLWPSSTKAEMLACFTIILTAPVKVQVTIHIDSKVTLDGFNNLPTFCQLSSRKKEKIFNYTL